MISEISLIYAQSRIYRVSIIANFTPFVNAIFRSKWLVETVGNRAAIDLEIFFCYNCFIESEKALDFFLSKTS